MGDGAQQEGRIWEAAMYAPIRKMNNIIASIDLNRKKNEVKTETMIGKGNRKDRWKALGWQINDTKILNNLQAVVTQLNVAKDLLENGRPVLNLLHTEIGYGVDLMTATHKWHGVAPNDEQLEKALAQVPETLGDY